MRKSIVSLALTALVFSFNAALFAYDWPSDLKESLKTQVVNVHITRQYPLSLLPYDDAGESWGTGFVVDAKQGLIVTNKHVAGTSDVDIDVEFRDGTKTDASIVYYDYYHDFAFLKFDTTKVPSSAFSEATLSSSFTLKENDDVLLIGNNAAQEYSVKPGAVSNMVMKSDFITQIFQTSIDRSGGSSGAPVFNTKGEVVGLHFSGSSTYSNEIYIDYVVDALKALREGQDPARGGVSLSFSYAKVDDLKTYCGFDGDKYSADLVDDDKRKVKNLLQVKGSFDGPDANELNPGDIIWSIDGELVKDNLYLMEKLLNKKVGANAEAVVIREGKLKTLSVKVVDLNKDKITKFVRGAGAVFHDINQMIQAQFKYPAKGVFMSYVQQGYDLYNYGYDALNDEGKEAPGRRYLIIESIGGNHIDNIDEFIKILKDVCGNDIDGKCRTNINFCDMRSANRGCWEGFVTLKFSSDPLSTYVHNPKTYTWDKVD